MKLQVVGLVSLMLVLVLVDYAATKNYVRWDEHVLPDVPNEPFVPDDPADPTDQYCKYMYFTKKYSYRACKNGPPVSVPCKERYNTRCGFGGWSRCTRYRYKLCKEFSQKYYIAYGIHRVRECVPLP